MKLAIVPAPRVEPPPMYAILRRATSTSRNQRRARAVHAVPAEAQLPSRIHGAREIARDLPRAAVRSRRLRREHDLERVVGVLRPGHGHAVLLDAVEQMPQPLGPLPARIALGEQLPGAGAVAPELVALGRPVVSEHLQHAFASVQL